MFAFPRPPFLRLSPVPRPIPPLSTSTPSHHPSTGSREPTGAMINSVAGPSSSSQLQIDPTLHRLAFGSNDVPIDPALFELEGLVNDVRRGKVKLDDPLDGHDAAVGEDNEIDPALREIVNSLTNAQQSSTGPALTHAQAQAAIGAHLTEHDDTAKLQQSLEELTHASYNGFFPTPPNAFEPLPTSPRPPSPSVPASDTPLPRPRGRGRPLGSKNKPKPKPPPKPKAPKPPPKPRGRPPNQRTEEEQAEYERRKQDKAMGIKRQKGRPRKYPGFLVRDMRLKRNRAEFHEVQRRAENGLSLEGIEMKPPPELNPDPNAEAGDAGMALDGQEAHHVHGLEEDHDMAHDHGHGQEQGGDDLYGWPSDDQALLDAVGAARLADDGPMGMHDKAGESGIHEMFGLNAVTGDEGSSSSFR